jgi:hypothetical protein
METDNGNIINVNFTDDDTTTESIEREIREDLGAEKRQLAFARDLIEELIRMASLYEAGGSEGDVNTPMIVREVASKLQHTLMLPALDEFKALDV